MTMRPTELWMVYRHPADGISGGAMGVCRAAEWAALDAVRPGALTLVQAGVPSEGMAERLARGTTGDSAPRAKPVRSGVPTAGQAMATGERGLGVGTVVGSPQSDGPEHVELCSPPLCS